MEVTTLFRSPAGRSAAQAAPAPPLLSGLSLEPRPHDAAPRRAARDGTSRSQSERARQPPQPIGRRGTLASPTLLLPPGGAVLRGSRGARPGPASQSEKGAAVARRAGM